MDKKLKVGFIGLGQRGYGLLWTVTESFPNIETDSVCDTYEDRVQKAAECVKEKLGTVPFMTNDINEVFARRPDAVIIASSWETHIQFAIAAMEAGIPVGCEVGGAYSTDECKALVEAYERTKTPCMMLENCCYGRNELMVLNMVRQGLFGEVVHCSGGYRHDLRAEIAYGEKNRHYRFRNYKNRCCENYPTHELGPIAKILNINRGNKMKTLYSSASCAKGLHEYILQHDDLAEYKDTSFIQADVVTTCITCENGQTVTLTLETTLPRAYSRSFSVSGTKASFCEDNMSLFIDGRDGENEWTWNKEWNNAEKRYSEFDHPLWKMTSEQGTIGGHGGMDGLVLNAFFNAVKNKTEMPIDVYDMASWMCITPLSEISIKTNSVVEIPDYTSGAWRTRKPLDP